NIEGDAFGKVYEYFLGKFAIAEGAKGGEYFTPTSIVRLIVETIEPFNGKILDPACGSGGMFVQSARFVEEHRRGGNQRLSIYGKERVEETVKLCKMNLAVHGLEGQVSQSAEPLPHVSRRRGVLRTRRVGWKPHRSSRGYSAISASPDPELRRPLHRSCRCWRDLQHSSGGPNEASQFASDRGQHLVWPDPTAQMPIARMQPQLGMPGQVHAGFGHIRLPLFECASHTWGMPRMVSGLAEHVPQQPVARLGDWSTMLLAASRRLRGNHAGVGHE